MRLPITIDWRQDLMAVMWVIKAAALYIILSQWIWDSQWARVEIAEPYTRVVAWELEKILRFLGYDVARDHSLLSITGLPFIIGIHRRCLGFLGGGFFIFLAFVLSLPSSSLRSRVYWLIIGSLVLTATNLLRLTFVIIFTVRDPSSFDLIHQGSIDINTLVGGVLALLAVRSLGLKSKGIKVFRRSRSLDTA